MIDADFAQRFAQAWVKAWNDHDLDAILAHYADDIVFRSPRIRMVMDVARDKVRGREELRAYWTRALELSHDLYFEIDALFVGSDALTICYTNHRQQEVAETFVFDAGGLVCESIAAYAF